jgi:hypothetical protein
MIPAFLRHDPIISGGISARWRGGDEISMVTDGFSLGKMLFPLEHEENNKGKQRLP